MNLRHIAAFVFVGILLSATVLLAHHSFAGTYDEDKTVTIEGKLAQFLMRNPHSFIHVDVTGKDGKVIRYSIEGAAGGQFSRDGFTRETLRHGDVVVVTGSPGRNAADHRMRLRTITRPSDGWKWGGTFD